jgi:putative glycosyltransferase
MKLSIVTTLYYSAPYIDEFYQRIRRQLDPITADYEFVFVNDGSPDNAFEVAVALCDRDPKVRVVDLSRNFGHHKAMMTGLAHAQGDLIFLIDVDLEEPPETLTPFYDLFQKNAVDVVYGVQQTRKDPLANRIFGSLFYRLFNFVSSHPIPHNVLTARLMTRRYVQQLIAHREHLFNIEGLWAITGFSQLPMTVDKLHYKGSSTYTLTKKIAYVTSAITAFSNKPLIYIAVLGLVMTIPSGVYILLILFQYFVLGYRVDGYTSLIVSLWFLGGLIIFILGIIAIYLSVIFVEVKNRPYTVVRQIYERTPEQGENQNHNAETREVSAKL